MFPYSDFVPFCLKPLLNFHSADLCSKCSFGSFSVLLFIRSALVLLTINILGFFYNILRFFLCFIFFLLIAAGFFSGCNFSFNSEELDCSWVFFFRLQFFI